MDITKKICVLVICACLGGVAQGAPEGQCSDGSAKTTLQRVVVDGSAAQEYQAGIDGLCGIFDVPDGVKSIMECDFERAGEKRLSFVCRYKENPQQLTQDEVRDFIQSLVEEDVFSWGCLCMPDELKQEFWYNGFQQCTSPLEKARFLTSKPLGSLRSFQERDALAEVFERNKRSHLWVIPMALGAIALPTSVTIALDPLKVSAGVGIPLCVASGLVVVRAAGILDKRNEMYCKAIEWVKKAPIRHPRYLDDQV